MVVAVDRYTAEDAAALVEVEYDARPVSVDIEDAVKPGAPLVHDTHPGNVAALFRPGLRQAGRGHPAGRARHEDPGQGRALDRGADGVPRRGRGVRCGHRRADGLGRDAGADLGARRPRLDLRPRRGQGARHRAECRRRLRAEGAAVLSRRAAGADGGDAARPAGQVHRGPARELHRLEPGADADPLRSSSTPRRPAR